MGIDLAGKGLALLDIEAQVGKKVDLGKEQDGGGLEHIRVFEGFILPFRHREEGDLRVLSEVEGGRADEIAVILDHENFERKRGIIFHPVSDHVRVKMAAAAGIDLHRRDAGRCDAVGIVSRLMIPFEDGIMQFVL
jgi:hypothetical protein